MTTAAYSEISTHRGTAPPTQPSGRVAFGMSEIARMIGISLPTIYALVNSGKLRTFLIGKRRYVTPAALEAFVAACDSATPAQSPFHLRKASNDRAPKNRKRLRDREAA